MGQVFLCSWLRASASPRCALWGQQGCMVSGKGLDGVLEAAFTPISTHCIVAGSMLSFPEVVPSVF